MVYILIKVKSKNLIENKKIKGKSIVKDEVALTTWTDPKINQASFAAMQKQEKEAALENGVLIERYPDMDKEKIADKIEQDLQNLKKKFRKMMIINWTRELVR